VNWRGCENKLSWPALVWGTPRGPQCSLPLCRHRDTDLVLCWREGMTRECKPALIDVKAECPALRAIVMSVRDEAVGHSAVCYLQVTRREHRESGRGSLYGNFPLLFCHMWALVKSCWPRNRSGSSHGFCSACKLVRNSCAKLSPWGTRGRQERLAQRHKNVDVTVRRNSALNWKDNRSFSAPVLRVRTGTVSSERTGCIFSLTLKTDAEGSFEMSAISY
jgi:hypothetical protein